MSVETAKYTNMTIYELADMLSKGAEVKRLSSMFDKEGGLIFTLVTEPEDEFNTRVKDLVANVISRVRSGNPSLKFGFRERTLLKKLCKKIIRSSTARLTSMSIYDDLGLIDTELIDSDSECIADDKINEILDGLRDGSSLFTLCKELSDDPSLDVYAEDYT